jgi:hypothetical protein
MYRTIDIATERWLGTVDRSSTEYRRINELVDDNRKTTYGGIAIQKRVSSAANQTVHISCSMQRLTDHHFTRQFGRRITLPEMTEAHRENLKFAMPVTQLHLFETRPVREVLAPEPLEGGSVEAYTRPEFFVFNNGGLRPVGDVIVEKVLDLSYPFPDGRIGCPGTKYIPEIWEWAGAVSAEFAFPALIPDSPDASYNFKVPGIPPQAQ